MLTAVTTAPDPSTDVAHMNATGHNHMTRAAPRPQVTPATLDDKALVWLACTLITSFLICIHCVESSVLRCSYFYQSFFPSVICSANTARAAPFFFFHTFVCAPEFQTGPLEEKGKECPRKHEVAFTRRNIELRVATALLWPTLWTVALTDHVDVYQQLVVVSQMLKCNFVRVNIAHWHTPVGNTHTYYIYKPLTQENYVSCSYFWVRLTASTAVNQAHIIYGATVPLEPHKSNGDGPRKEGNNYMLPLSLLTHNCAQPNWIVSTRAKSCQLPPYNPLVWSVNQMITMATPVFLTLYLFWVHLEQLCLTTSKKKKKKKISTRVLIR